LTYLRHAAINNEVLSIDEATLVTGKKEDSVGLLNSFTKAT
jgi:hypothetical protein